MQNLLLILTILFSSTCLLAQTPVGFKYQAVARDASDKPVEEQTISLRFSILEGSSTGTLVYSETHKPVTSPHGIFSLNIGTGNVQSGTFAHIDWGDIQHWLKVEMDINAGNNYQLMGTSELLAVPYAIHAETVTHKDDADADPDNEIQTLSFDVNNNKLSISGGNEITIPTGGTDADPDPTNELQNLSLVGNVLSISDGNSVNLQSSSSPWVPDGTGIKYEGPKVRIFDPSNFDEQVTIYPSSMSVDKQNGFKSFLRGDELIFQNLDITPNMATEYGYWGMEIYKPGNPLVTFAKFNKDSLYMFDEIEGPGTTKLFPGELMLDYNNEIKADLSPHGLSISNQTNSTYLDVNGLELMEYNSNPWGDVRVSLMPDSLRLISDTKWKIVELGRDNLSDAGALSLFQNGGTDRIAYLGGFPSFNNGASLELFSNGYLGAVMETTSGNGNLSLLDMNENVLFNANAWGFLGGGSASVLDTFQAPHVEMWVTRDSLPGFPEVRSLGHIYSSWDVTSPNFFAQDEWNFSSMHPFAVISDGSLMVQKPAEWDGNVLNYYLPYVELTHAEEAGVIDVRGPNGNLNFSVEPSLLNPNAAYCDVYDTDGYPRAGMYIDPFTNEGRLYADIKNFRMDHPTKSNKEIWYASLEGPEAAAYIRGTAKLQNGEVFVPFPEHFQHVANPNTMTVILTPNSIETYGLAVVEKTAEGIRVKELMNRTGNFSFDWEVKCVRKGHEDFEVVREKVQRVARETQKISLKKSERPAASSNLNFKSNKSNKK